MARAAGASASTADSIESLLARLGADIHLDGQVAMVDDYLGERPQRLGQHGLQLSVIQFRPRGRQSGLHCIRAITGLSSPTTVVSRPKIAAVASVILRTVGGIDALVVEAATEGTWGNNIQYLHLGFVGANLQFWQETLANPASRSITVDLLFLFLAVSMWMLLEARRVGIKHGWLYVILGIFIAISVTFPLFMMNRERALSKLEGTSAAGELNITEGAIIAFSALVACAYTFIALVR